METAVFEDSHIVEELAVCEVEGYSVIERGAIVVPINEAYLSCE